MPNAPKWLFDTLEFLTPKLPLTEVVETVSLSKSVKRICFKGDLKNVQFTVGSFIDFRINDTEARRYTVSHADTEKSLFEFVVYLNGKGCGSRLMADLKVGDQIVMYKPRALSRYYDKTTQRFVIFGDETSLALACSFLPVLKKNKHQFMFIFELEEENKDVPKLLGLENCLIFSKNFLSNRQEWVGKLPVIDTPDWQEAKFVLTGNAKSAQLFRKIIRENANGTVYLHGYWLAGKKGL
ncbi:MULTISPECIES: FAD-binding oxidoreductase [Sphingobacterium]|uniref:FAD-binding oxidoreductase n=1 Tax=Sphingobacterium TaxID=28453 RepID=UPI002579D7DB|nr:MULTISPECIES: FAD-binding oxidoreductase [Sphingobacterium]